MMRTPRNISVSIDRSYSRSSKLLAPRQAHDLTPIETGILLPARQHKRHGRPRKAHALHLQVEVGVGGVVFLTRSAGEQIPHASHQLSIGPTDREGNIDMCWIASPPWVLNQVVVERENKHLGMWPRHCTEDRSYGFRKVALHLGSEARSEVSLFISEYSSP